MSFVKDYHPEIPRTHRVPVSLRSSVFRHLSAPESSQSASAYDTELQGLARQWLCDLGAIAIPYHGSSSTASTMKVIATDMSQTVALASYEVVRLGYFVFGGGTSKGTGGY